MLSPLLPEEFPPAGPRVQRPSSHGRDFKASAVRGSDTVPLGRRNTVPRGVGEFSPRLSGCSSPGGGASLGGAPSALGVPGGNHSSFSSSNSSQCVASALSSCSGVVLGSGFFPC